MAMIVHLFATAALAVALAGQAKADATRTRSVIVFGCWDLTHSGPDICEHAYVRNAANLVCEAVSGPGIQDVLDEGWRIATIRPAQHDVPIETYRAEVERMVAERKVTPSLSPALHPDALACASHITVHCSGTEYVLERD
jgi:hypothetical protein